MAAKRKKTAPTEDIADKVRRATTPIQKLNRFEPKSALQVEVLKVIGQHDVSFVIGPTGTGKTYLTVVAGLRSLFKRGGNVDKLIIVRPAITAQEDIGFLPGGADEKLAHFVAPVHDHICDLIGKDEFKKLCEKGKIETIPVGYLRGRNFKNSFVIFDEAQNATIDQFKLVITRIADNSKVVVCGDVRQCDIYEKQSGLNDAVPRFNDDPSFGFINLPPTEIHRHPIVAKILAKYDEY